MGRRLSLSQREFSRMFKKLGPTGLSARIAEETQGLFDGNMEFLEDIPGVIAWYLDGWVLDDLTLDMEMNTGISLQFVQSVKGCRQINERRRRKFVGGSYYLACFQDGARQSRYFEKGAYLRYVGLWITPDILKSQFIDFSTIKNEEFVSFLDGEMSATVDLDGPLSVRMQTCMDELFDNEFQGQLRQRFLQAKITEIICSALSGLSLPKHVIGTAERTTQQSLKVQRAATILETRLSAPPNCRELAREVSIGHNLLNTLFKDIYGCTIQQYSKRCRMSRAEALLRIGKHSMIEIAELTGYNCQSSFSRAFKAYHGINPSTVSEEPNNK